MRDPFLLIMATLAVAAAAPAASAARTVQEAPDNLPCAARLFAAASLVGPDSGISSQELLRSGHEFIELEVGVLSGGLGDFDGSFRRSAAEEGLALREAVIAVPEGAGRRAARSRLFAEANECLRVLGARLQAEDDLLMSVLEDSANRPAFTSEDLLAIQEAGRRAAANPEAGTTAPNPAEPPTGTASAPPKVATNQAPSGRGQAGCIARSVQIFRERGWPLTHGEPGPNWVGVAGRHPTLPLIAITRCDISGYVAVFGALDGPDEAGLQVEVDRILARLR